MTRFITDKQRSELFEAASNMENPIGEIETLADVLDRIAKSMKDYADTGVLFMVSSEIKRRTTQVFEVHEKLFHGLHESPGVDDDFRLDLLLAIATSTGKSLDVLEAQSRGMDPQSFHKWADEQSISTGGQ